MKDEKIFYYHFDKINVWSIINAALTIMLIWCAIKCPCLYLWTQTQILIGLCIVSWSAWAWKHLLKHKAVIIDKEGIKIDFCQKLKWKDVAKVEEKTVRCCFRNCRIISIIPKEGIDYHYNYLQKHNGPFTPFAVPLYGILTKEDEEELAKLIYQKVK